MVSISSANDVCRNVTELQSLEGQPLGGCAKGWRGVVCGLTPINGLAIGWSEMERRLLEMGFVEGARVEILHHGPIGHDPIAVRVDDTTIALRRRDANAVLARASE